MKPKIRLVPITQLVLDEKNSNSGTKRGRELLDGSLEKYGAGIPEPKWTCPVSASIRHRATACVKTCSSPEAAINAVAMGAIRMGHRTSERRREHDQEKLQELPHTMDRWNRWNTIQYALVLCGAAPFFFFLDTSWAQPALLGYLMTGAAVVTLAGEFGPPSSLWFWKALLLVATIQMVAVGTFVWLDFSVPEVNPMSRMLYGFAAVALIAELRLSFWIIEVCKRHSTNS